MFLMKKTNTLTSFFTQGNKRTLRAKRNITVSFISKAISIMISFIIVPLTLGYVGRVEYGIWMTISSIIAWFSFFDIGLGNGLRNKLAEALAKEDTEIVVGIFLTSKENSPFSLVVVPFVVPFSTTFINDKASPLVSVTFPLIVWALMVTAPANKNITVKNFNKLFCFI